MANILLLDDNETFLKLQGEFLRCSGHRVATFTDGKKALQMLQRKPFDLLITDLIMPDKEGIEIIIELHSKLPDLKIIAMSGGSRVGARDWLVMAKKLGASHTLIKPFSGEQLLEVVNSVLGDTERPKAGIKLSENDRQKS
jgi:DNA-binding NtrC family response regulator